MWLLKSPMNQKQRKAKHLLPSQRVSGSNPDKRSCYLPNTWASLQKSATCFDDPATWNILCPLMRDSCGLKGKQSHTPHTRSRIPPENGSLQGEKRKRRTHTQRVSAGNRWKLALIALLTSDPRGEKVRQRQTHTYAHFFFFFYVRAFTLRHFAGRSNCRATVCVEGRGVTSHHMRVRITTSWIRFDVGGAEGRRRRVSRSCLRFCVENVTIIACYDGVIKESDDESRHCALKRKLSSKGPEFPERLH